MNTKKEYLQIMNQQMEIALATSAGGQPSVRIVNFVLDPNKEGTLYFSTFKENQKAKEIEKNPLVAFTTIPTNGTTAHVKVQKAVAKVSNKTIFEVADLFSKIPGYADNIKHIGEFLVLYEIHFTEALVVIDMESSDILTFSGKDND